jgi:hypothetical protein
MASPMLSGMTAAEYPACTPGARYGAAQLFFVSGVYGAPAGLCVRRARSDGGGVRDLRPAVWGGAVGEPAGAAGVDGDDAGGLDRDVRSARHALLLAFADGCASPGSSS